jgi:hypothetical protein
MGFWLVKGRFYAAGGAAYRRAFPSWSDFFDNALCTDELRWSIEARIASPLGKAGVLDCRAFLEGQAVDATADQGLSVCYYPLPELGVAFVMEKNSRLLLGEVKDIGADIVYAAGRFLELAVTWRSRDYVTAGDQDNVLGVQLSIRM